MLSNATTFAGDKSSLTPRKSEIRQKELDLLGVPRRLRVSVAHSNRADIGPLLAAAEAAMKVPLAPEQVVARVAAMHPDALWTFRRGERVVGGFALLLLNADGLAALLADSIDLLNPPMELLAKASAAPAAIYTWALLGPATAAEGVARVLARLQLPPYDQSDMYGHPATQSGLRLMRSLGFKTVPGHPRKLLRYERLCNRVNQSNEGQHAESEHI